MYEVMCEPISMKATSSIALSMYWPRPVRSRWNSAAEIANAHIVPVA